jgi:hypothetical protein
MVTPVRRPRSDHVRGEGAQGVVIAQQVAKPGVGGRVQQQLAIVGAFVDQPAHVLRRVIAPRLARRLRQEPLAIVADLLRTEHVLQDEVAIGIQLLLTVRIECCYGIRHSH